MQIAGARHKRASLAGNRPNWHSCENVQAICRNWSLTAELQKALFDHDVGAVVTLFTWLEPNHNGS